MELVTATTEDASFKEEASVCLNRPHPPFQKSKRNVRRKFQFRYHSQYTAGAISGFGTRAALVLQSIQTDCHSPL
jgi:hypothetical protein